MNRNQVEGKWQDFTSVARERWGKFTHDECRLVVDERDQLVGWIQERYGTGSRKADR